MCFTPSQPRYLPTSWHGSPTMVGKQHIFSEYLLEDFPIWSRPTRKWQNRNCCNKREEIAEGFGEFFSNKITKIRQSFTGTSQYHPTEDTSMPKLTSFRPLTEDEVKREVMSMKNKNCELDQISKLTLKAIITACLPSITHIVNMSLTRGFFITDWKLVLVKPLLKNLAQNLYIETTDLSQTYAFLPN